jgi:peptidoglycan/xylan/chitin deacetylase (PgdA/CDA1 family)
MTALTYHDVVPAGDENTSGFAGRDAALYKVTPELFDAHLRAIRQSLPDRPDPPDPSNLIFTFDDGGASALGAADALERYGLRGRFFVTVNYIGTRGFLDPAGIRELQRRGHEVGSHSCSHPLRMGHLSPARLRDEWTTSRAALSDILGEDIRTASLPGGDFAPSVATAATDAGFTHLFTSEPIMTVRQIGSMTIAGRFTIQRWTSASTAAALAAGRWLPCTRQVALWNMKKLGKQIGGERYLQMRRVLLRHDHEVRWGDRG